MHVHCPTCLELFTTEDDLRSPPCGHVFHQECIQKWLRNRRESDDVPNCPQCRKPTALNSLMKIYLAEADVVSQEDRDRDFERKLDDLERKIELTEAERNSLLDRVAELEDDLKGQTEELTKNQSEITAMKNENTILSQKLSRCEREIGEAGKIKDKWLQSKKSLQELEEKQIILKGKLRESVKNREESEKQRKVAEKHRNGADNEKDQLEKKLKETEKQNAILKNQVSELKLRLSELKVNNQDDEWITCSWCLSPEIPARGDELETIHVLCPEIPAEGW